MASVRENLIAAKALIDTPEKWCKGAYEHLGCYCALGALGMAEKGSPTRYSLDGMRGLRVWVQLPFTSVSAFNDDPTTTHADVMALFDRAIAAQVEE